MRIARVSIDGEAAYGVVELQADGGRYPETVSLLTGDPLAQQVQLTGQRRDLADARLLAPVIPRSKVLGVGRNYADHARELGNEVPASPLIFVKPNTSVVGPGDAIVRGGATRLGFEGELALVISRICREVPADRAQEVIFGYTVANDVTARDWQESDGQWWRAKGSDTYCPIGPWLITHLSVAEASDLTITTRLDGEIRQQASTALMVFGIPQLIEHITAHLTLLPGDVILTGTPAGVGLMEPGQQVSVEIDQVGRLDNTVAA